MARTCLNSLKLLDIQDIFIANSCGTKGSNRPKTYVTIRKYVQKIFSECNLLDWPICLSPWTAL